MNKIYSVFHFFFHCFRNVAAHCEIRLTLKYCIASLVVSMVFPLSHKQTQTLTFSYNILGSNLVRVSRRTSSRAHIWHGGTELHMQLNYSRTCGMRCSSNEGHNQTNPAIIRNNNYTDYIEDGLGHSQQQPQSVNSRRLFRTSNSSHEVNGTQMALWKKHRGTPLCFECAHTRVSFIHHTHTHNTYDISLGPNAFRIADLYQHKANSAVRTHDFSKICVFGNVQRRKNKYTPMCDGWKSGNCNRETSELNTHTDLMICSFVTFSVFVFIAFKREIKTHIFMCGDVSRIAFLIGSSN